MKSSTCIITIALAFCVLVTIIIMSSHKFRSFRASLFFCQINFRKFVCICSSRCDLFLITFMNVSIVLHVFFSVHWLLVEILINAFPLFLANNSVSLNFLEFYSSYKILFVIVTTCFVILIWYWAEI